MNARNKGIYGFGRDGDKIIPTYRNDESMIHVFSENEHWVLEEVKGNITIRLKETMEEWNKRHHTPNGQLIDL
jgi:hypothetical protein